MVGKRNWGLDLPFIRTKVLPLAETNSKSTWKILKMESWKIMCPLTAGFFRPKIIKAYRTWRSRVNEAQTKAASTVVPNKLLPGSRALCVDVPGGFFGAWDLIQVGIDSRNRRHGIYVSHEKNPLTFHHINYTDWLLNRILIMVSEIIPI